MGNVHGRRLMDLEDAREGKRYKVTWESDPNDGGPEGSFTAVLVRKTYKPSPIPPDLEPFLESALWDNGVTTGGYNYDLEKA